ncbi:MAG: AAA family ATPase [Phycisphaeraceae bacterium]
MTANPLGASTPPTQPATGGGSVRFRPIDPIKTLRANVVPLVITLVIGLVLGVAVHLVLRSTSPQYTSTILLTYQTPIRQASDIGLETGRGRDIIEMRILSETQRIRGQEVMQRAIEQPSVQATTWFQQFDSPDDARRSLANNHLVVRTQRNSLLIELGVWTEIPSEAAPIANAVAQAYDSILRAGLNQGDESAVASLTSSLRQLDEDVDRLRRQQRTFLQTERLESLRREGSAAAQEFQILNEQMTGIKLQLEQATAQYEQLANAQSRGDVQIGPDLESELEMMPAIQRMNNQMSQLREAKRALLARFGEGHQQIRIIDAQIAATEQEKSSEKSRIAREIQAGRLETSGKIVEQLRATLEGLQPRLDESSRKMVDLTERLARYTQLEDELTRMLNQRQVVQSELGSIRNRRQLTDERLQIRQISQPNEAELTFPKLMVIVPGITVALLGLVTGLIFVRELLDQRVMSPTDVRMLSRGNLLGLLPDATEDPSGSGTIDRVVERDANSLIAEQFRQVRTAVLRRMEQAGHKSLMITASQPTCGTTTVAHNLATSLAMNHRKVILLDANFRRPRLAALLGLSSDRGLADVLRGDASIDQVTTLAGESGLAVVPAGHTSNAVSDLFDTQTFRDLIADLSARYDLVILDAPPALLSSDPVLMSKSVDAVATVVRAGADKRGMADRMLRQLDGHKAEVLGVILNWVQSSAGGYFRKNYQAYYDYQSTSGPDRLSA